MEKKDQSGCGVKTENLIVVRGGGDLATGVIQKLWNSGFPVLVLETEQPSAIRRRVALSEAVYKGSAAVEGMTARKVNSLDEAWETLKEREIPILVDPACAVLDKIKPLALVDAIIAKRNLGTHREMARHTIALGPGFTAGVDVDLVIETMRGHNLGRILHTGSAHPNTGVPGIIAGYGKERVVHAPETGRLHLLHDIGDTVEKGEALALIEPPETAALTGERNGLHSTSELSEASGKVVTVPAPLSGLLRGILPEGYPVLRGMKMADVDPRLSEYDNCFTISDKARCIGGGVLEALLFLMREDGHDLS